MQLDEVRPLSQRNSIPYLNKMLGELQSFENPRNYGNSPLIFYRGKLDDPMSSSALETLFVACAAPDRNCSRMYGHHEPPIVAEF